MEGGGPHCMGRCYHMSAQGLKPPGHWAALENWSPSVLSLWWCQAAPGPCCRGWGAGETQVPCSALGRTGDPRSEE